MIRHIVMMKFADETPAGHIEAFAEKMHALLPIIPQIKSLEFGIDEIKDARSWQVSLVMSFANIDDLRTYQAHPDHVAAVAFNKPYLEHVASVDYTVAD